MTIEERSALQGGDLLGVTGDDGTEYWFLIVGNANGVPLMVAVDRLSDELLDKVRKLDGPQPPAPPKKYFCRDCRKELTDPNDACGVLYPATATSPRYTVEPLCGACATKREEAKQNVVVQ